MNSTQPPIKFAGLPLFIESFHPHQESLHDLELNAISEGQLRSQRELSGLCNLSGERVSFKLHSDNIREDMFASGSHSINRQRQLMCGLSQALFDHPYATLPEIAAHINGQGLRIYNTEANGQVHTALSAHVWPELLTTSEYLGDSYQSGQIVNGVRHEDLQATSFPDASFDIILSAEVFEHIPDAPRAEAEVIRLLRPDGVYVFTVPFAAQSEADIVRAILDENGQLQHLMPPEYHGDPVRPDEGILVFRIFSYFGLQERFTGLGCDFTSYRLWSKTLGILGNNCIVHVARKSTDNMKAEAAQTIHPQAAITPQMLAQRFAEDAQQILQRGLNHRYFEAWQVQGFYLIPNHFYSPIPDTRLLASDLWDKASALVGIDMQEAGQLALLEDIFPQFRAEYEAIPFDATDEPQQFYLNNGLFSGTDALVLHCMLRHVQPKRMIEVGSGMSTLVSAHALDLNGGAHFIAIEPYPNEILQTGLNGLSELIVKRIQEVELSFFDQLQAGDVLFIDTSHVVQADGDVNRLFLEILPRLNAGVMVHVHDIFLPLEYPRAWIMDEHRFWTEQYLLQAFLIGNADFEVVFANTYMAHYHLQAMRATFPTSNWWGGGSFWMQKKG